MIFIGPFIILMLTVSEIESTGFLCFREEEKQRYTNNSESDTCASDEERKQNCIVNTTTYMYTDIFACGDVNGTYLKRSCLICGRVCRSSPLCPNEKDEPNRHLTCLDCKNYSNACQNGGTPYCPQEHSYAPSMRCLCQDGYKGTFCENEVIKVYRQCTCHSISRTTPSLPPCDISGQPQCYIIVLGGNSSCECEDTTTDIPDQSVPNCNNLPANITEEITELFTVEIGGNRPNVPSKSETSIQENCSEGHKWNFTLELYLLFLYFLYT